MIIYLSCVMAFVAIGAMLYMYRCVVRSLHGSLMKLQEERKEACRDVAELLPGLASGQAATWQIDRKALVLTFDGDCHERMGMAHSVWNVADFRKLCNQDCLDVFDKWIGQYSKLTNAVCRRLRFHLTLDGGKSYHWWELVYNLDNFTSKLQDMHGVFVNIDHVVEVESAIDDARNKMYESELKQTFFASINHDLRTPLNAIAGFANLLAVQYDELSDEDRKSFAEIVKINGDMLMKLLGDINVTNCNDIDNMKFKPRNKSVRELLDVVYLTNKVICPSHLHFILESDKSLDDKHIYVDSKRIEQVINNFLSNSFKFTQVGFVKLGWRYLPDTSEVEIYVSDSGTGIKEENIERLFDQYFKINEHAHGTGLGLNICKKIVDKQGGTIHVDSKSGEGSTFFCRFKEVEDV